MARQGNSVGVLEPGLTMRGSDVAYDPARDLFFTVVGNGPVYGVFTDTAGTIKSGVIPIMDGSLGWGHFPRVSYSPHVMGGQGGFLVTWHHNVGNVNVVFGRIVSLAAAGGLATPIFQISDGSQGGSWHETGVAMAYSQTSGRFLVAWRTMQYGILGRLIGADGAPLGGIIPLENPGGSRDPSLTWNPGTNDFGLAYSGFDGGAHVTFRRVRVDGVVFPRTTFGYSGGTFATAVDVNRNDNTYTVAWAVHPGTLAVRFDANGNLMTAANLITGRLGFDQSLDLGYDGGSGTFVAVSSDLGSFEVGAIEVNALGLPNSTAAVVTNGAKLGSFYPMVVGRGVGNLVAVAYSRDFRGATMQFLTNVLGGANPPIAPPPPPVTSCATPDPFVSIGGGTCVNGGWIPGRQSPAPTPTPTPTPTPPTGGCTIPDPFVSLGGGTCINGGWVPWR